MSGGTLLDVLELSMGDHYNSFPRLPLTAPDPTAYTVFQRIFHPWIEEYHHYKIDERYLAISKVHLRLKSQCSIKSDLKDLLDFYLIQFLEIFWNFYIFLSVSQCRVLIDF